LLAFDLDHLGCGVALVETVEEFLFLSLELFHQLVDERESGGLVLREDVGNLLLRVDV
jgi:hypothetical protein